MRSAAGVGEPDPTAPAWFVDVLAVPREHGYTEVSGCRVSYWRWGQAGLPGVVMVHGGGAHGGWWDHIAPWLVTEDRCVVAVDLSGHGDSGHRQTYGLGDWAAEMLAVARHAELDGPAVLAGHSLGAWSTVVAAAEHPEAVAGLILMDCRITDPPPEEVDPPAQEADLTADKSGGSGERTVRGPRIYPTLEEALARYRPEPAQDGNLPFVMRHLAVSSTRQVEGGWTWKFDPRVLVQRRPGAAALRQITCPVTIIRGERGLVTPPILEEMQAALGGRAPVIEVPLAGHHLMLDQPLCLVTALRSVLAEWATPKP